MGEERDDLAEPKLTTGTTDDKLVRIEQLLRGMKRGAERESWDRLGITLTIAGAGFVFSGASLEEKAAILGGFLTSLLGVGIVASGPLSHILGKCLKSVRQLHHRGNRIKR